MDKSKDLDVLYSYDDLLKNYKIEMSDVQKDGQKLSCHFSLFGNDRKINQLPSGFKHLITLWSVMSLHKESIFLLDEPENSLYPSEQIKLINFFIKNSQKRTKNHQFFIATHSPFILKTFLCNKEKNYVIVDTRTGKNIDAIEDKEMIFSDDSNVNYEEISFLYYGISSPLYYLALYEKLRYIIKESHKIDHTKTDDNQTTLNNAIQQDNEYTNSIDKWMRENKELIKNVFNGNFYWENINFIRPDIFKEDQIKKEYFTLKQTSLTKLRNLITHGKQEKTYYFYSKNDNNKKSFQTKH